MTAVAPNRVTTAEGTFELGGTHPIPVPVDPAASVPVELDEFPTLVARWNQVTFPEPVPYIARWDVRPGDQVFSSMGYSLLVTEVRRTLHPQTGDRNGTVQIFGRVHGTGAIRTESFEGSMPLLARGPRRYSTLIKDL